MSKLTQAAATSQVLSLAAMEEASRRGQRVADIDDLLLALSLAPDSAGQVLRSFGITLDAAREAVAAQHNEQLASLGIEVEAPMSGEITFHKTGGYSWSERALAIFTASSKGHARGDSVAVLRALVIEPSGLIRAILRRLEVDHDALPARLEEVDRLSTGCTRRRSDPLTRTIEAFVPAAPERVWALLSAAERMPEWNQTIGGVTPPSVPPHVGDSWHATGQTQAPDGKPVKVKAQYLNLSIELLEADAPYSISWRLRFTDAPKANARVIRLQLAPAAAGTQVRVAFTWERSHLRSRPRILAWFMRPLVRFAVWMQAHAVGTGIARVFR